MMSDLGCERGLNSRCENNPKRSRYMAYNKRSWLHTSCSSVTEVWRRCQNCRQACWWSTTAVLFRQTCAFTLFRGGEKNTHVWNAEKWKVLKPLHNNSADENKTQADSTGARGDGTRRRLLWSASVKSTDCPPPLCASGDVNAEVQHKHTKHQSFLLL